MPKFACPHVSDGVHRSATIEAASAADAEAVRGRLTWAGGGAAWRTRAGWAALLLSVLGVSTTLLPTAGEPEKQIASLAVSDSIGDARSMLP